jgi:ribosomal protein S18 acetylase RimI-like enzyme
MWTMGDLGVHRVTRTRFGRAVYEALDRLGVTGTSMYVYARSLEEYEPDREPPADVAIDVVRASELTVAPDPDFGDLRPADFVAVARDAEGPPATSLDAGAVADSGEGGGDTGVYGWVFLTLERPVEVTELSATVRFDGAYVWHLYVNPGSRGRGIASALVAAALEFAAGDRLDSAYALVAKDNVPSQRVFAARGFEVVDEVAYYRVLDWERRHGPLHRDKEYSL